MGAQSGGTARVIAGMTIDRLGRPSVCGRTARSRSRFLPLPDELAPASRRHCGSSRPFHSPAVGCPRSGRGRASVIESSAIWKVERRPNSEAKAHSLTAHKTSSDNVLTCREKCRAPHAPSAAKWLRDPPSPRAAKRPPSRKSCPSGPASPNFHHAGRPDRWRRNRMVMGGNLEGRHRRDHDGSRATRAEGG